MLLGSYIPQSHIANHKRSVPRQCVPLWLNEHGASKQDAPRSWRAGGTGGDE